MSAASARGARRERQAAAALGTRRVLRQRGESAPDLVAVRLPCGASLGPEVKSRRRLPVLVTSALAQAERYWRGRAIPVAVLYQNGESDGIACMALGAFAALVGIESTALPSAGPLPKRRASRQLPLPGVV